MRYFITSQPVCYFKDCVAFDLRYVLLSVFISTASKRRQSPEGKTANIDAIQLLPACVCSCVPIPVVIYRWESGFQCADLSEGAGPHPHPQNQADRGRTNILFFL